VTAILFAPRPPPREDGRVVAGLLRLALEADPLRYARQARRRQVNPLNAWRGGRRW